MMGCENSKESGSSTSSAAAAAAPAAAAAATAGSARPFRDPSVALPRAAPTKAGTKTVGATTTTAKNKKADAGHVKNVFAKPLDVPADYRPPVHEKTQDEMDFITTALQKNFVFENMSPRELKPLIMAFEKSQVASGETIISQGDAGDYFYIIQMGACSFSVDGKEVGQAKTGDSFGELALLYTCPRAASVKATVNTTLLRVDQTSFRFILQNQTKEGFKAKQDLLTKLSFLQDLDEENINKLTAVMTPHPFKKGDYLMRKGAVADYFYVIQEGTLVATNIGVADSKFEDVTMGPGEYCGERALVTGEPRAADVIAQTDGMCFCIDEKTFKKVLGNLNELILRAQDQRKLSSIKVIRDSHFDTQTLASLCRLFKDKEVKTGDVLFKEGDVVEAALYMVRIPCKVVIKNKAGTLNENRDGGGYFGDQELLADAKAGKNKAGDPTTIVSEYTVEVVEGGMLGVLTLAACRTVFDTLLIGQELAGKGLAGHGLAKADIKLENLVRHKILGAGTFGQVWLVSDKAASGGDKTPYALKIQSKYELVKDGQAKAVVDEKNIMAQLQHPFLIRLVATFKDERFVYILLDLVQGGELYSIIHQPRNDGMPEKHAMFYAAGVAEGLAFMHRRGFVYRDLKPENVLIDKEGYPVIIDFGFAKFVKDKTYTLCGTPLYLPPEVILNRGHNWSADHWSLGVLIFELISGDTPFYEQGMDQMDLFRAIVKGEYFLPRNFSEKVGSIVDGLLTKNPAQRLGSLANREDDIYSHPWFANVNWDRFRQKLVKAPNVPKIKNPLDASNFDDWSHLEDKTKMDFPALKPAQEQLFDAF